MMTVMTNLHVGESAKVISVRTKGSMRRRLMDLGLIEGTVVKCVQKSPAGDPTAYAVRGATIALRAEDSADILVAPMG